MTSYDESDLRTYKVALENIVKIGGFWVVGQDKNLYSINMPDKVGERMWKDAKRYDIQTGKVMDYTNADRIRAMTDEELAEWVNFHTDCENCPNRGCTDPYSNPNFCVNSLLSWLKSPAEEQT